MPFDCRLRGQICSHLGNKNILIRPDYVTVHVISIIIIKTGFNFNLIFQAIKT